MDTATALEEFVSGLAVTQGERAGQPFECLPWERRFLQGTWAGNASVAALTVARGNGKSTFVAALALAALEGPLAVPRGEVLIVASSLSQAKVVFRHTVAFMRDRAEYSIRDNANFASATHKTRGTFLRCLGCDPKRAHGRAPSLVLADEPAQWIASYSERMYAALETSLGKQPGAKLIALGTRSADKGHWFERLLDGGADYAQVHSGRRGWTMDESIAAANPSIEYLAALREAIERDRRRLASDPSRLASFRALRLNLGELDYLRDHVCQPDQWASAEAGAEQAGREGPCVWGLDLGTSYSFSAVAAYWPQSGRLECLAAVPAEPSLAERAKRDGRPGLYERMAEREELLTVGAAAVDIGGLLDRCAARYGVPSLLVADRWRQADLEQARRGTNLCSVPVEYRGMGFRDGGEDVRRFRKALAEGQVRPLASLLLRSAMAEAVTVSDPAGNAKLAKNTQGGRRARAKDDACAASILAVSAGVRDVAPAAAKVDIYVPEWDAYGGIGTHLG